MIETVTDPARAEELWNFFSPRQTLYDDWQFRFTFFSRSGGEIHFLVLFVPEDQVPAALLPLQRNAEGVLEFFGGPFMEDNLVFTRPSCAALGAALYAAVPGPACLDDIGERDQAVGAADAPAFESEPYTGYVAELADLGDAEEYLAREFRSKTRAGIRKNVERLRSEYAATVEPGRPEDLEILFELNRRNFGVESTFHLPGREDVFRELARTAAEPVPLVLRARGEVIGVSFSLGYADQYVYLNAGVRHDEFAGAGTFLILANIAEALRRGKTLFDGGVEDLGWKERWHLRPVKRYRLVVPG